MEERTRRVYHGRPSDGLNHAANVQGTGYIFQAGLLPTRNGMSPSYQDTV